MPVRLQYYSTDPMRIFPRLLTLLMLLFCLAGCSTPAPEPLVLTLDSGGQTVTLRPGQALQLQLGTELQWTYRVEDERVLAVEGPGLFRAARAGQTELRAVGVLPCKTTNLNCRAPDLRYHLAVLVAR